MNGIGGKIWGRKLTGGQDGGYSVGMQNGPGRDGKSNDKVVNRTVFRDGSELIEFEGGSMMIVESGLAKAQVGAEQAARYDQPAPKPQRPDDD